MRSNVGNGFTGTVRSRILDAQARMGWKGFYADDGLPPRKNGMHKRTYERLARRFKWAEMEMNLEGVAKFGARFDL